MTRHRADQNKKIQFFHFQAAKHFHFQAAKHFYFQATKQNQMEEISYK